MTTDLNQMRGILIRQEETIIFALIERAQFKHNPIIYEPGGITVPNFDGAFSDFMLYETEKLHACVRRYTSPDEYQFFPNLPVPILPIDDVDTPIKITDINVNEQIKELYLEHIVPEICQPGDCGNYGSSAVCDVTCLQALSKRIHYGKHIAEAKFRDAPDEYGDRIRAKDRDGIMDLLVVKEVEERLLERVERKARTYGHDPGEENPVFKIRPEVIVRLYEKWIIPLTCEVEVQYLLQRLD